MHGTIAFKIRGESPGGFIARISILGRKPANMISFLKALNCIRADNMNSTQDSFHTSESLVKDIKRMIQRNNEAACVGLVQLGAAVNVNTVVKPRLGLGPTTRRQGSPTGSRSLARTYLDIHHAIGTSPTTEVTKSVPTSLCTLVLSSMASASRDDFQEAVETMAEGSVARNDVDYRWAPALSHGRWSTGGTMSAGDKSQWLASSAPFQF